MYTLEALNERRITQANYFQRFKQMAKIIYESGPFRGDPHAFCYSVPKNSQGEAEFLRSVAIMATNRYPGDIFRVKPAPRFGRYHESAFIQRIRNGEEEQLKTSFDNGSAAISPHILKETAQKILEGRIMWEHMVGGQATRLKIYDDKSLPTKVPKEKFVLNPADLAERYAEFYPEAKAEAQKAKKPFKLPAPSSLPAVDDMGIEESALFGVRHMLAFAQSIKRLADEHGFNWQEALSRQTVFIIANEKIIPTILELLKTFGFFGLDADKVYIMATQNYNALILTENGELLTQKADDFIHNHGAARLETTEDDKWFTVKDGKRTYHSAEEIRQVYARHDNLQSLNIEDLSYLDQAIDVHALALALNAAQIVGGGEYNMMMDVVGQQDPPQKGGVLAVDPEFSGPDTERLVMIESFQTYPRFFHYMDAVARKLWREINWLNLNMNNYPNPVVLFEKMRKEGLPVWLEMKNGFIRNESPQGDANYFLPTLFVARTVVDENGEEQPITITNLKEAAHIPKGLIHLSRQGKQPGFESLVREFHRTGLSLTDYSFVDLSKISGVPLDINAILAHPFLKQRIEKRAAEVLKGLKEVFQVKGSVVFSARTEEGKVLVRVMPETVRGTASAYPLSAKDKEEEASPQDARIYRQGGIWTGAEEGFSYVTIANQKEAGGEIIRLLGEYDENVPNEKKPLYLRDKLARVIESFAGPDGRVSLETKDVVAEAFMDLKWQFLYENSASEIAQKISAETGKPSIPPPEPDKKA
jgi:hypothetical protein